MLGNDYEIICIDDGSKDNSLEILERYKTKGLRVYSQPNAGVSRTRNRGIELAEGTYIRFVDSDDLIEPQTCHVIIQELEKRCADGCAMSFKSVPEHFEFPKGTLSSASVSFTEKVVSMSNVWSLIIKKEYLIEHNIRFNEQMAYGEDTLFNYYVRLYKHKFIYSTAVLYYYRNVPTSAMNSKDEKSMMKYFVSTMCMLDCFKAQLDKGDEIELGGDAKTEERYYWSIQNALFAILRRPKSKRKELFKNLCSAGHYPYPIQLKRLICDSPSLEMFCVNLFCLLFPIKVYYKFLMKIF